MRVLDIMHRDVVTVGPDETLAGAANVLHEHSISAVVVVTDGQPVGILTERDFVHAIVVADDPNTVSVGHKMSGDLITVESRTDVAEAAQLMAERNIRHLPVVDHGRLIGIVSIRDPVMRHPALRRIEEDRRRSVQTRVADGITSFAGSMPFVYLHAAWFGLWIVLRVEHYPYGLLTMIVSLEAIFLSTFVMLSQNRADTKRQALADHQWEIVQYEEKQNDELLRLSQRILELTAIIHELTVREPLTPTPGRAEPPSA
jgi:CBS domain-containing protein